MFLHTKGFSIHTYIYTHILALGSYFVIYLYDMLLLAQTGSFKGFWKNEKMDK